MKVISYAPVTHGGHGARTLFFCCGVIELGNLLIEDTDNRVSGHPTLEQLPVQGTGIFIVNYIEHPASKMAKEYLDANHILLYQADNIRNTSLNAGKGGVSGITTCLYRHKDASSVDILPDIYPRKAV